MKGFGTSALTSQLPQWIVFDTHEIRSIVFCCRMRAATLLIRDFFGARSAHQARMAVISFDAARLGVEPVRFLALPGELLLNGPRTSPHGRIFDGHDVFQRGRAPARPTLDQMKVLTGALVVGLRTEVRLPRLP